MKEKFNMKSIIAALVVLLIGILLVVADSTWLKTENAWAVSVGCSLIASAAVILLTDLLVDRVKENPLKSWGIQKIYRTRAEMNIDCAVSMKKAKYQVDVIAFGLKSYRTEQDKLTRQLLQRGVNFRILTMAPSSGFVSQREKEEEETQGQIANTIQQLVEWADEMNRRSDKGKIVVKGYTCMTLDFYWRVDNDLYIGPYWYGRSSQQTISYQYSAGTAKSLYEDYFDELWNDPDLTVFLTNNKEIESGRSLPYI